MLGRGSVDRDVTDVWAAVRAAATAALRAVLAHPYLASRSTLGPRELQYVAQALEDAVAERILSPLLRLGDVAWRRLAADVSEARRPWRVIRRAWISPTYPEAWQAQMWQRYVPVGSAARRTLIEAMNARQAQGTAPRSFERRLVFHVQRHEGTWVIASAEFEGADPGDESPFRIEVSRTHGQPP